MPEMHLIGRMMAFTRIVKLFAILFLCSYFNEIESICSGSTRTSTIREGGNVVDALAAIRTGWCSFPRETRIVETRAQDYPSHFPSTAFFLESIRQYLTPGYHNINLKEGESPVQCKSETKMKAEKTNTDRNNIIASKINECSSFPPYTIQLTDVGVASDGGYERRVSHVTRSAFPSENYSRERKYTSYKPILPSLFK